MTVAVSSTSETAPARPSALSRPTLSRHNVTVHGAGAETVVFAHGFGTDQTAWSAQVDALPRGKRAILFDHIGAAPNNCSYYSPVRYSTMYAFAADLVRILEQLDVRDAVVVGHSMSGVASLLASLLCPSRIRKLVLIGASARYLNDGAYHGGFAQADLDALYEAMSANYYAWAAGFAPLAMGNAGRPDLASYFARTLCRVRPDIALGVLKLAFQSDYRSELPRVTANTWVLQTERDIAVPMQAAEYLATHIPGAQLQVLRAEGHFPHISSPEEVSRALHDILAE